MILSRKRIIEILCQIDDEDHPDDIAATVESMSAKDWKKFSEFLHLINLEGQDQCNAAIEVLYESLNPKQSLSALSPPLEAKVVIEQALKQMKEDEKELRLLRSVYEHARRVLRFNGIDDKETGKSLDKMDDAIEMVKQLYGGTLDD